MSRMMTSKPFDPNHFKPNTPTEMMLMNYIVKQESQLRYLQNSELKPWDESEAISVKELPKKIELYPSAKLALNVDELGRLKIRMDAYPSDCKQFGSQYMVERHGLNKFTAADHANELYQQHLHYVADFLQNGE